MPGIFISYRRSDNPDAVGRIYDRLVSEFGKARVFKDVDSIPLGQDFRGHLNDIVGNCVAVLAIIGPKWTDIRSETGQRRLDDPDDFVRIELEAALERKVPVVPVLVGHAAMPSTGQLPASLTTLAFRQAIDVRPDPDFHHDATRLVSALRVIIDPGAPRDPHTNDVISPKDAAALAVARQRSWLPWLAGLATATTLAAIALAPPAFRYLLLTPAAETRTEIRLPAPTGAERGFALSPDGKQIVSVVSVDGVSHLWLRPLAATTGQLLPGTDGAWYPFWSPDSRSIAFLTSSALKRVDLGGGAPLTLAPVAYGYGGTWNADGVILFSQGTGNAIARIPATGGAVTEVTRLEQEARAHAVPVFLPDGGRFLFASAGGNAPGIYLGGLDGRAPVRLTSSSGAIAFHPSGWLLHWPFEQEVLIAQRLDADKPALVGAPLTLVEGDGLVTTSATGLVAYWSRTLKEGPRQLLWRNRSGGELGTLGEPDPTYFSPRVSRDGQRVVVSRVAGGPRDLWVLDGSRTRRITFGGEGNDYPLWSPDGARIVFNSRSDGGGSLQQIPADGAGEASSLLDPGSSTFAASSWSPDGRHLLYVVAGSGTGLDLAVLPMTGDRKVWKFLDSTFDEGGGEFSPDGKWVAYESNESARREVYVRPFVEPSAGGAAPASRSGKWQVSIEGGTYPKWSPDGSELYFLNPAGEMMAAPIAYVGSAIAPGTPVKLFDAHILGAGTDFQQGPQYDVAPDGRFLINTVPGAAAGGSTITLIQNWNPDAGK